MEEEFRAQLSESGYQHEIMAEFGDEEAGVFNKVYVDKAMTFDNYAYNPLTSIQRDRCEMKNQFPTMLIPKPGETYPNNPFRTMGVDWDRRQADSSILILDYDREFERFRVLKRVNFPKAEYTYDKAVQLIIQLNEIYNPSWIYADTGAGEYQIERLHIYGDEHPSSGLKVKVKGFQFSQVLEIMDPITKVTERKPMKPFMVNSLARAFEKDRIMLSPYDELVHKQLIDYKVDRISQNGMPVYTSVNEHFVDALGLAYLAFVLEFPQITREIKKVQNSFRMVTSPINLGAGREAVLDLANMENRQKSMWHQLPDDYYDPRERKGDKQQWIQLPMGTRHNPRLGRSWGSRTGRGTGTNRKMW